MKKRILKILVFIVIGVYTLIPGFSIAEDVINLNANNLLPKAEIFITPKQGTFLVGSTFEAPIYIDTKGNSVNAIQLKVNFDPNKLSIVNPSGGKSIFGIWVEPPQYDNRAGTASLSGVIPDGIVTSSGLIITITFKVISSGTTRVSISEQTTANLNDGLGSEILLNKTGASYALQNRAPNGVNIFSTTHPSQDSWYNNNSPFIEWETNTNLTGFSVLFDNTAQSIPKSEITTKEASQFFENIKDGIWYVHVRALSKGVWGATSNFAVRIDTQPPAKFKLDVSKFKDSSSNKKYLISFFTTDTLSGVKSYEVGVIEKSESGNGSPVFVETKSPYMVPFDTNSKSRVIVRATDFAGNVREEYVDLYPGFSFVSLIKKFGIYILILIILLLILELILHYIFGHHIMDHFKNALKAFKKVYKAEENIDVSNTNKNLNSSVSIKQDEVLIETKKDL